MDVKALIEKLSAEEKAALLSGVDFMFTNPVPRLNIPSVRMSDGPHGLRVQKDGADNGVTGSEAATSFPTAACTAASWNPENTYKIGEAIAKEALYYGVNILLGPGVNIKRNPLCGRNFEYFSEDPYLAGKMAASEVKGVQSKGVGTSVKHFALNNSENYRFMGDSICDMRAAREIYLKAFEIAIKEGNPHTVMCAYNKINGEYCCENEWLLTDILRKEWGFDGAVMSDWGATHDRLKGVKAGLDLEMPGDTAICRKRIIEGEKDGSLKKDDIDKATENILRLVGRYQNTSKKENVDWKAHDALAAEIAEDSAVLLKNDGILPLDKDEHVLVIGDLFDKMRYQGAGSSMINPTYLTTPKNAFDSRKINYTFLRGYAENELQPNTSLMAQALDAANKYNHVLVFAGLTDYVESEGADRENMRLPENQLAMIDALTELGKKVTVVLFGGSPVELPFADKVSAILNMYLPGQNGGSAVYNLLFGVKSPCGKLPETWVRSYSDVPFGSEYGKNINEVYKESIFVGYRYYLTAKKDVLYPFGFGLSYTTFEYNDMDVKESENEITISCEISNTGNYDGAEIVELYVKSPKEGVFKPEKELKSFTKVYLKKGESKKAIITLKKEDLRYWNVKENRWAFESGNYEIQLCSDCQTVKSSKTLTLKEECAPIPYPDDVNNIYASTSFDKVTNELFERMSGIKIPPLPPTKPITIESRFTDMTQTFMGRILFNAVLSVAKKDMRKAKKLPEGTERDNKIKGALFLKRILESNSIITL
ncbi:MAG: glycoside hydrolase family 3 C-terminal domain-containing protein, partial [Eubacteriales bacterium]